ncbi:MAG: DHA2 family efflux MFS transporter permease subunit [Sciscionella sp.]
MTEPAVTEPALAHPHGTDPGRWRALTVCLIAGFMTLLDVSIVNVALPSMQRGLHASGADVSWVVSGYALTFGLVLVPSGKLGDMFGRKPMFLIGLGLFTATSVFCGLAPNATTLVIGRLLQGVAGGVLNPQVIGMIQQLFRGRERGKAFGLFGAVIGISTAIGPVVGGLLIQWSNPTSGWRWVFYVNLPIGLLALVFGVLLLPRTPRGAQRHSVDALGIGLLGFGVVSIMLPLIEDEENTGSVHWYLLALGAVLLLGFALWERRYERRGHKPLVSLNLLRDRAFAVGSTIGLLYFAGFTGIFLVLSVYLQTGLGYSALEAGAALLSFAVGSAGAAAVGGRIVHRFGRPLVVIGMLAVAAGLSGTALLITTYTGGDVALVLFGPLLLAGLGSGLVIAPNQTLALDDIPPAEGGTAAGVLQTGQRIGSAVGTAVAGSLFFGELTRSHGDFENAASRGLFGSAALVVVALVAGILDLVLAARAARAGPATDRAPARAQTADPPIAEADPVRALDATSAPTVEPARTPSLGITGHLHGELREPLAAAAITVTTASGSQVGVGTSNAAGRYSIPIARPGHYLLICSAPGYQPTVRPVRLAAVWQDCDAELRSDTSIAGSVSAGADHRPLRGTSVVLLDRHGVLAARAVTDEAGRYLLQGLPAGSYTLIASGHAPVAERLRVRTGASTRKDISFG